MQRESCFLRYRPSSIAAASLMFSIAFSQSKSIEKIVKIRQRSKSQLQDKIEEEFGKTLLSDSAFDEIDSDSDDPLRLWNSQIENLTSVSKLNDVKPTYLKLFSMLDVVCYKGLLKNETTLLPK